MKTIKRTLAIILAISMCFSMSTVALAADPSTSSEDPSLCGNVIGQATYLVSDGHITLTESRGNTSGIMPLSSVSGYNQGAIVNGYGTLYIRCNGTGKGGMGITIQTGCSYGDYKIHYHGYSMYGDAGEIKGDMYTNDEVKLYDCWQYNLTEYVIDFSAYDDDGTPQFFVKVWIYS